MKKTVNTELGAIRVHEEVICSIAKSAALEIEGVAKLSESPNKFFDALGIKTKKGVKVEIDETNEIKITVFLVIKYGFHLSEVAHQVQENIRKAIEKMTDLTLREVNIDIKDMFN